jgi:hypothetical protein
VLERERERERQRGIWKKNENDTLKCNGTVLLLGYAHVASTYSLTYLDRPFSAIFYTKMANSKSKDEMFYSSILYRYDVDFHYQPA